MSQVVEGQHVLQWLFVSPMTPGVQVQPLAPNLSNGVFLLWRCDAVQGKGPRRVEWEGRHQAFNLNKLIDFLVWSC